MCRGASIGCDGGPASEKRHRSAWFAVEGASLPHEDSSVVNLRPCDLRQKFPFTPSAAGSQSAGEAAADIIFVQWSFCCSPVAKVYS